MVKDLHEHAPNWVSQLQLLTVSKRSDNTALKDSKASDRKERDNKFACLLTSIVLFRQAPILSSFFPMQLGLYLQACGTPDRALSTLSKLGLIPSPDTLRRHRDGIGKHSKVSRIIEKKFF